MPRSKVDYKKHILPVVGQAEKSLLEMELAKKKFAESFQAQRFDDANQYGIFIYTNLKSILERFRYVPRRSRSRWKFKSVDFKKDHRLISLTTTLRSIIAKVKAAMDAVNLGDFVKYTDMAHRHCYMILSRAEDLMGSDPEPIHALLKPDAPIQKRKAINTSPRMRENMDNWKSWIEEERLRQKELEIERESEFERLVKQIEGD